MEPNAAKLILNGRAYSLTDLRQGVAAGHGSFESEVLHFCSRWLSGESNFTLASSGTTGTSKKIIATRQRMQASAMATQRALGLKPGDIAIMGLDARYIAGKMMLVRMMTIGLQLWAVEPTANPFQLLPAAIPFDFAAMVPYQVQTVLECEPQSLERIGKLIIGGAALPAAALPRLQSITTQCYATYGMTETLSHVALQKINGPDRSEHYTALPGVSFTVNVHDCLVIHAPALLDGPLITHDVVELLGPQQFRWLGRWDNVINSGGIKIVPETLEPTVEHAVRDLGLPNRFFIAATPHEKLGQQVTLVLEGRVDNPEILMTLLKQRLEKHHIPKRVLACDQFVETATGKINRRASLALATSA
jgi:O-succinylbenzoic acid--CoA ligase